GRMLWPVGPRAVYEFSLVGLDSRLLFALAAWAALALLAWRGPLWLRRGLLVAASVYALALLPVGGLIPIRFPVADRYTLVPSLALLGPALTLLFSRAPRLGAVGVVACAVVLAPL